MNYTLAFLGGVGAQEILLIGLFVLVFFGAKKIPEFMKGLGKGVREFKTGMSDMTKQIEDAGNAEPEKPVAKKTEIRQSTTEE
jgi:sec-independent protein translocase protein TatA